MKRKNLNKKGEEEEMLSKETLNIIIAVICICALVYLAVLIYFAVTGTQNVKFAQAVVNGDSTKHGIADEIRRINVGGMNNNSYFIPNPSGWWIFSFVGQDIKPNTCAGSNCLCVCEKLLVGIFSVDSRQAQRCDDKGSCVAVWNLKKFDPIEIKGAGIFVSIKNVNGQIEINKK
jgi:hypothetical protein